MSLSVLVCGLKRTFTRTQVHPRDGDIEGKFRSYPITDDDRDAAAAAFLRQSSRVDNRTRGVRDTPVGNAHPHAGARTRPGHAGTDMLIGDPLKASGRHTDGCCVSGIRRVSSAIINQRSPSNMLMPPSEIPSARARSSINP